MDDSKLLTIDDVAKYLQMHPRTIMRMVDRGELPAVRFGASVRFEVEAVRAFVEANTVRTGG
jgi:excisionase family DNA binding protein